jgi:hypothetical protein
MFRWVLESITGTLWNDENITTYRFNGIHRLLSQLKISRPPYTNQTVQSIYDTIIDQFNAKYPITGELWQLITNQITDSTIITRTEADYFTMMDAMNDTAKISQWSFFLKPNGELVGWQKPSTATHRFMIGTDVRNLEISKLDLWDIINRVFVSGHWFENTDSIDLYWVREAIEDIRTWHLPTIEAYAEKYLAENWILLREITLDVFQKDYSNIYPWQTIKLLNTNLENVDNLTIKKTSYDGEKMRLYLEKYKSLAWMIKNT